MTSTGGPLPKEGKFPIWKIRKDKNKKKKLVQIRKIHHKVLRDRKDKANCILVRICPLNKMKTNRHVTQKVMEGKEP